jgi:hypothetical protein
MTPLDIPVPPADLLEPAIGWSGGDARWLSVCWTCCGDCPWIEDGRSSMTGHAWGLLAWWRHPSVAPVVQDLDLGSSDRDGTQRLLLAVEQRQVFVATTEEARRVVREQWPAEEPVEMSSDEWERLVREVRESILNRPLPNAAELMRLMTEQSRVVADMIRWLDAKRAEQAGE